MHVHIYSVDSEAKFWLEPQVLLAQKYGLSGREINKVQRVVEERIDEIKASWRKHFRS